MLYILSFWRANYTHESTVYFNIHLAKISRPICLDRAMPGTCHGLMVYSGLRQTVARNIPRLRVMGGLEFLLVASLMLFLPSACSRQASFPPPEQIGPNIVTDTSSLDRDVSKFYSARIAKINVNFFVIKKDNRLLSFLDACSSCYLASRDPDVKTTRLGSCYPIKIGGRRENGKYIIPVDTLKKEADTF